MEFMERATRKRSAKPGRMAASGLPIGMPLTLPSGFARARRLRSSMRLKLSPVSSRLIGRVDAFLGDPPGSVRTGNRFGRARAGPGDLRRSGRQEFGSLLVSKKLNRKLGAVVAGKLAAS